MLAAFGGKVSFWLCPVSSSGWLPGLDNVQECCTGQPEPQKKSGALEGHLITANKIINNSRLHFNLEFPCICSAAPESDAPPVIDQKASKAHKCMGTVVKVKQGHNKDMVFTIDLISVGLLMQVTQTS